MEDTNKKDVMISTDLSLLLAKLVAKHKTPYHMVERLIHEFTRYKTEVNHAKMSFENIKETLEIYLSEIITHMEALQLDDTFINKVCAEEDKEEEAKLTQ